MITTADITIAGGGLAGTSLALALADAGLSVVLVDPDQTKTRQSDTFDGRSYALSLASQQLLLALGIWEDLAPHGEPILQIKISDGGPKRQTSPLVLEFDHAEIEEGPMGYVVEDRYLRQALLAALDKRDLITQLNGQTVVAHEVTAGNVKTTVSGGREIVSSVLIGCDGKRSSTAERSGIHRTGWRYGQTALVCAIAHEKPHNGTAFQHFQPGGPLALLPLPGNRSSIVWSESTAEAARISALPESDYIKELSQRLGGFLGQITLAGQRFSYPLELTVADSFVLDRMALVGDAAHGLHPIAGQGLNAGLKDVASLAEVLIMASRRGEDIGRLDVLERYQQWRRFDTATMAVATDTFNRLFSNDNSMLRIGRDLGMGIVNNLPGLRRAFIREAAGLTGDLPKLLQGKPI